MDVYLLPLGPGRFELYSEPADELRAGAGDERAGSILRRAWRRFREMVRAAEDAERNGTSHGSRFGDRLLRWVAERIAEQRLLWHLRTCEAATLHHAPEVDPHEALALMRTHLDRDWRRHRRWIWLHVVLAAITGPLFFFVPGPNLVAYYFVFRAVGHYLSARGARQGLHGVRWTTRSCAALSDLRLALAQRGAGRRARLQEIAHAMGLPRLAPFLERVTRGDA